MFAVRLEVFLHGVVGEMNRLRVEVRGVVPRGTRAHVTVLVDPHGTVRGHGGELADVELSAVNQRGRLDVLLHDPRRRVRLLGEMPLHLGRAGENLDASTAVGRAGLDDPRGVVT